MKRESVLAALGIEPISSGAYAGGWREGSGPSIESIDPTTEQPIGTVRMADAADYEAAVQASVDAFEQWRMVPAPQRGDYVRQIGNALREYKEPLGALVSMEVGKIRAEGEGEIQEMIDIADFAVGLSRQLYGLTIASERPRHRMFEQWQPLGPVGIISAFNFPAAVWSWNAFLAAVCGDSMIWKPSPVTPLTAVAIQNICHEVMEGSGFEGVFNLTVGDVDPVGAAMVDDPRLPLIAATGSVRMGRQVGTQVAKRLGRSLLELGGNNAIIVMDDADLDLAVRGALFAAAGTAGQRCTSLRRLIVHKDIADLLAKKLIAAYGQIPMGDPLEEGTLVGPLVSQSAVDNTKAALEIALEQGGELLAGGNEPDRQGFFLEPMLVKLPKDAPIAQQETFGPMMYFIEVDSFEEALAVNNGVPQGLSSAIFTDSIRTSERFLSAEGSDCGIANVNIGTSGAEIGGAFGGEKETGGGRQAGSDSWKAYMRRQTVTVNWSTDLPLAQGVEFG
ncbi:MAG: aldehyde dehydrogenase family protein [Armatimonadetes bacterium]|nr:MAG: aldehyde dehydrogenase family protein [Armatimonadota bacterium]